MEVGMMAASEVATATCMRYSSGTPAKRNENSSTGTVTMPPPTPSRPARKPAATPGTARMAIGGGNAAARPLAAAGGVGGAALGGFAEGPPGAPGGRRLTFADEGHGDRSRGAPADI